MAEQLRTVGLWKNQIVGAQGTAGTLTSDVIDLKGPAPSPVAFSVSYKLASTNGTAGAGTAGSSKLMCLAAPVRDGSYSTIGTFGTFGNDPLQSGFVSMTPGAFGISGELMPIPYMKIQLVSGTSNPVVATAELHMQ